MRGRETSLTDSERVLRTGQRDPKPQTVLRVVPNGIMGQKQVDLKDEGACVDTQYVERGE